MMTNLVQFSVKNVIVIPDCIVQVQRFHSLCIGMDELNSTQRPFLWLKISVHITNTAFGLNPMKL